MELLRVFLSFLCCSIISLDLSSGGPVFSNGWDCCCATLEFSVCTHSAVPHHIIVIVNRALNSIPSNQWNWSRYFVCCCCWYNFFSSFRLSHLSLMLYFFFFICCCCARFLSNKNIFLMCLANPLASFLSSSFVTLCSSSGLDFFPRRDMTTTATSETAKKNLWPSGICGCWDTEQKSNKKLTRARDDDSITGDEHEIAKFSWR